MKRRLLNGTAALAAMLLAVGCGSMTGDDTDADGDAPDEGLGDEIDVPVDGDGDGPDGACRCTSDDECQDHRSCNGEEQCVACECRPGIPPDDGTACDDGDPCTEGETCRAGVCTGGLSVCPCDTDDDCLPSDDGNRCNGRMLCVGHECRFAPETIVTCDPTGDTDCQVNLCDPTTGDCARTRVADGMSCDDGNPCTFPDACSGGRCVGTETGRTLCPDGECYDLRTDPDHCGDCATACRFDEDCADGRCVVRAWETVGGAAVNPTLPALAHALGTDGAGPFVAWVADEVVDHAYVHRSSAAGWVRVGDALDGAGAQPVIDIQFHGTTPYVFYADQGAAATTPDHVKAFDTAGSGWIEVGAPGYRPPCSMHFNAALALDGPQPHFSFVGAGGCGIGVGYARWTGSGWWETPSPPSPMRPGRITMIGGGSSDVVYDGRRALVALIDNGWRYVRRWDASVDPGSWVNVGPSFNQNPPGLAAVGANYLWMALDATGRTWVAFAEQDGGVQKVFVRRYDPVADAWTRIGGGPVSDPTRNSDYPSLAFVGGTPYVAWVEDVTRPSGSGVGGGTIRVARWNGLAWERVGAPLNQDATADAVLPYLVGIGTVPYVAFREPVTAPQRIYVKRFP